MTGDVAKRDGQKKKRTRDSRSLEDELALFEQEIAQVAASVTPTEEPEQRVGEDSIGVSSGGTDGRLRKAKKQKKMSEQELEAAMMQFDQEIAEAAAAATAIAPASTAQGNGKASIGVPSDTDTASSTAAADSSGATAIATVSAAPTQFYPISDLRRMQQQQTTEPLGQSQQSASSRQYYFHQEGHSQYGHGQYFDTGANVDYNALLSQSGSQQQHIHQQQQEQEQQHVKPIKRTADGKTWEDPKLAQFPENDFRIFVGNIGNDVTDEVLARAFQHFPSFVMARVVRDKKTRKSKGYGFVSLMDPNDFLKALDTMNGKYIGNRPCHLKRSKWRERNIDSAKSRKTRQMYR